MNTNNKVGISDRLSRLGRRLSDPEWRRYGYLLLAGKMLGIALLLGMMAVFCTIAGTDAHAADPVVKANDIINPINTLWTLLAAFLVFGMQAGLTMLEAGFAARARRSTS